MDYGRPGFRIVAALMGALFVLAACGPFVARVKGGSESKPKWEIGVKF